MTAGRRRIWPLAVIRLMGRINYGVALLCGAALLATAVLVLAEIVLRQTAGRGLGGSDEIAGYVMAGVAAWGFSYALVERAHVRIDVLTGRLPPGGRALFDLVSLMSVCGVAAVVSFYGWYVFARSLERGSRANTPLETPLWIPQSIWVAGWIWLTLVAGVLTICVAALIAMRRFGAVHRAAGVGAAIEDKP